MGCRKEMEGRRNELYTPSVGKSSVGRITDLRSIPLLPTPQSVQETNCMNSHRKVRHQTQLTSGDTGS